MQDLAYNIQILCLVSQHPDPSIVLEAVEPYPWLPEHYLIPVIEDDPLLQLDFEPDEQSSNDGEISLEKK